MITPDAAADRLAACWGQPRREPRESVLGALVQTILSQHTSRANCIAAYTRLRERFPDWRDVLESDVAHVAEAIAPAGLANLRAPRLQALLARIDAELGELDLERLRQWDDQRVRDWLVTLKGVGPKTAACVLLFGLGRADFPVDTHVWRIALRLGWLPPGTSAEAAYRQLRDAVSPAQRYSLHMNLVRHGREVCHARRPACAACVLRPDCPWPDGSSSAP